MKQSEEEVLSQFEIDHIVRKHFKDDSQKDEIPELPLIPLEKLIPSKDVRKQCEKEGRIFDLREQATLVWNNPSLIVNERLLLLEKILEQANEDSKWEELSKQIGERIKISKEFERKFISCEEKQFFRISYRDKKSKTVEEERMLFSDAEKAKKYAYFELADFSLDEEYIITKGYLDSADEISCVFNRKDELKDVYFNNFDSDDYCDNTHFENAYVLLPHPFRNGDFVRTIGCEEIGIFKGCKNEEEYIKDQEFRKNLADKGYSDFSDVSCTAEYYYEKENKQFFSHSHPLLINLEFTAPGENETIYKVLKGLQPLDSEKYFDFYLETLNDVLKDEVLYELESADESGVNIYTYNSELVKLKIRLKDSFPYIENALSKDKLNYLLSMIEIRINYLSKFYPIIRIDAHYRTAFVELLELIKEHYYKMKVRLYDE